MHCFRLFTPVLTEEMKEFLKQLERQRSDLILGVDQFRIRFDLSQREAFNLYLAWRDNKHPVSVILFVDMPRKYSNIYGGISVDDFSSYYEWFKHTEGVPPLEIKEELEFIEKLLENAGETA